MKVAKQEEKKDNREVNTQGNRNLENFKEVELEEEIEDILYELEISEYVKAYQYLFEAIKQVYQNPKLLRAMTKELYPAIAKKYNTTWKGVEYTIRCTIQSTIRNIEPWVKEKYFRDIIYCRNGRAPTITQFISIVIGYLKNKDTLEE